MPGTLRLYKSLKTFESSNLKTFRTSKNLTNLNFLTIHKHYGIMWTLQQKIEVAEFFILHDALNKRLGRHTFF